MATSPELQELITRRSSIKGQVTKFKNYLTGVLTKDKLSSLELDELSIRLKKYETLYSRFDDLQSKIEVLNSANIDSEIDERDDMAQLIINHIARANSIIQRYSVNQNPFKRLNSSECPEFASCHVPNNEIGFKLPQIKIANFDGAYFRWLEFRDTFLSLIHKNDRIAPIHKFHYLLSYLEGDAARIVSNLEVSNDNYENAWRLICERYDNKRLLINHHLNSLFSIQQITRESDKALRALIDNVTKNLRALANLGQPTDKWDLLIIHMVCSKLDNRTLTKWEEQRSTSNDIPTLPQFQKFLVDRADVLESLHRGAVASSGKFVASLPHKQPTGPNKLDRLQSKSFACTSQSSSQLRCVVCNGDHRIYDCPTFKAQSVEGRIAQANLLKLCINCLRPGHTVYNCRLGPCRSCKKRHNTLLHKPYPTQKESTDTPCETIATFSHQNINQVILSTALIEVFNTVTNKSIKVRALLDCGSQSSFITRSLKQKLGLDSTSTNIINIVGIGNNITNQASEKCNIKLRSLTTSFSIILNCLVLPELTGDVPKSFIKIPNIKLPKHIKLADPNFNQPAPIELLIGADIFWDIVLGYEQRIWSPGFPKLINSQLGWLIAGSTNATVLSNYIQCNTAMSQSLINENLDNQLSRFWELEELPQITHLTAVEKACEDHFKLNTVQLDTGRFCVKLPLSDSPDCLGDSYALARSRFLSLERRFRKQPHVKQQYVDFIREYSKLNHLSESSVAKPDVSYFLCHHAVFKANSESTKIRVVFDGSAPTTSGQSLNDILLIGANIQDSLLSILIRARQYKYILTGDIEKMYRQILLSKEDRNLQLILWREEESQPLKTLRLNTVTYGLASSSYLSTRCLWQAGEQCQDPLIKTIIQRDFYVDDLITGSDDPAVLNYIKQSVESALKGCCFNLRKFKSNLSSVLDEIDSSDNLDISSSTSTLGLGWTPSTDCLHFPIQAPNTNEVPTKRSILSSSFKIFDPLGLLSPCVILPKIMLQQLWLEKVGWDDPVPPTIQNAWYKFTSTLPYLSTIEIPRRVLSDDFLIIELHSFSDASKTAYGACVYLRTTNANDEVKVSLLCAKSKISPIKPTTIPRLELCAALLAARLSKFVVNSLRCKIDRQVHWCDSSVVLGWLRSSHRNLKIFVANRVVEICELTDSLTWRHVPTSQNPADLISRGIYPDKLQNASLWWSGPKFLTHSEELWPNLNFTLDDELPEIKANVARTVRVVGDSIIQIQNYSNYMKLKRIFAFMLRFIHNIKNPKTRLSGNSLSAAELYNSFLGLCRLAQQESFASEYHILSNGKPLSPKSPILSLAPFFDNSLIRVGGRIAASDLPYDGKHPILLHSNHHFTKLVFKYEHTRNLHAGPQLLLSVIRDYVWPISGRRLARTTVRNCTICARFRGRTFQPMMGNLPSQRITPDFPFRTVGIDFAGPFLILNRRGRGSKLIKCYLCLFVCLRYKCLHLEAVSDLTKDAFILTFRRFVSRRGKPAEVFCDNGRNFVAAAKEFGDFIASNADALSDFASEDGVKFSFSPAYAPHFGGIWEAGVKSAKYHIKRVMGNTHVTFEEIATLFAQVEAILNSRPLCSLSSDPNDLLCLTPGHFLIGRALNALPSPALEDKEANKLDRYARLEQIRQHFWQRWQREYVSTLQQRIKWKTNSEKNPKIGDLVLLQEDHVPPLCWRLGRILKLYLGADGIARVADVKTTKGCVRRSLTRICPLPTVDEFNRRELQDQSSNGGEDVKEPDEIS